MLRTLAVLFGLVFLALGILGFVPSALKDGDLFGIFRLNLTHNIIHIITGLIALWVGITSEYASKVFFQVFGVVYGVVAILGFVYGDKEILGLVANNTADTWLHLVIAVISLYLGFGCCSKCSSSR